MDELLSPVLAAMDAIRAVGRKRTALNRIVASACPVIDLPMRISMRAYDLPQPVRCAHCAQPAGAKDGRGGPDRIAEKGGGVGRFRIPGEGAKRRRHGRDSCRHIDLTTKNPRRPRCFPPP